MASSTSSSILHVPPPWHLKCDTWIVPFKTSASSPLPRDKILAPLEAASDAWTSEQKTGKFTGGVGYAYIVRYTESPVGTYDELAIVPGNYNAPEGVGCKGNYMRITGIWVSHEATLLNGRKNWNIPKCDSRRSDICPLLTVAGILRTSNSRPRRLSLFLSELR